MKAESIGQLIAKARKAERLTQAQLGRRMGTTQSAIARLEAGSSNPTLWTVEKALRACGHTLQPTARALDDSVDESMIAYALKMAPEQRLANHDRSRSKAVKFVKRSRSAPAGS
jgi:transcriptional regulator with XRE-family HTH domain